MKILDAVEQYGRLVMLHSREGERLYFFEDNTMIPADLFEDDTTENLVKAMRGEG